MPKFTSEEIRNVLPQQPPFLFLDSAEVEEKEVRALYHVRGDETFLSGHFKGNPVFPASIVFEALGQAGCLWVIQNATVNNLLKEVLFTGMDGARFYRKILPGETIQLKLTLTQFRKPLAIFRGSVTVNNERAAELEKLVLAFTLP